MIVLQIGAHVIVRELRKGQLQPADILNFDQRRENTKAVVLVLRIVEKVYTTQAIRNNVDNSHSN